METIELERLELSGRLLTCVKTSKDGRCMKYLQTCDGEDCISESPAHPLSGELLNCSAWQVVGRGKNKKLRCAAYKQACKPGWVDCAEPAAKKGKKPRKQPVKSDALSFENSILKQAAASKPLTIEEIADKLFLSPDFVASVVAKLEKENKLMVNETKGGIVVAYPKGKSQIGIKKEPTPEKGLAPWMRQEPFTAEEIAEYRQKTWHTNAVPNITFREASEIRENRIKNQMASRGVDKMPSDVYAALVDYKRALYRFYKDASPDAKERQEQSKEMIKKDAALDQAIRRIRQPEREVTPLKPEPAKQQPIWKQARPFTAEDTRSYNNYTHYPIKDMNDEFDKMLQSKLELVDKAMDKYGMKEIPEEVQTGLEWYRRRSYEFLKRQIYSKMHAPGAHIVGPSKYNVAKHKKVIAADQKYSDALDQSGKKLELAIRRHIVTRKESGKAKITQTDRDKWEAIAVKTKRTAFGKMGLEDYLKRAKTDPKIAETVKSLNLENPKSTFRPELRKQYRDMHARLIAEAHERGVPISADVLAEYAKMKPGQVAGIGNLLQAAQAVFSFSSLISNL